MDFAISDGFAFSPISYNDRELLREHHYYPFGMGMKGPWHHYELAAGNWYLYNGKELNTDLGLEWYDYGARWYDPAVRRFMAMETFFLTVCNLCPTC